jgi:hypothetical protein
LQPLYEARDGLQANLLRDHLAAHHIQSVVLGDYLSGAAGELPAVNFPVVWVLEDRDLPRARQLLEAFLTPAEPAAAWRCPACGAEVEGEFDLCWQCGAPRPEDEQD